jgi:predicted acylesterase/phospholipase RssA
MPPDHSTLATATPRLSLALGGGAVLGYAHVGVLTALTEESLVPTAISGTSAGAIAAALYAFGVPLEEQRVRLAELRWREISASTPAMRRGGRRYRRSAPPCSASSAPPPRARAACTPV